MSLSGMTRFVVALVALCAAAAPSEAEDAASERVKLSLVSEHRALVPGETNWLGVQFDIDQGWHLYWNGQNDAGAPPEVTIKAPEGITVGDLLWPAPQRHVSEGPILDHIYEKRLVLLLPVKVGAAAKASATVNVSATWIVCKSACEVGSGEASITLPIASAGKPEKAPGAPAIERSRARIPLPAPADGNVLTTAWKGSTLVISSPKGKKLAFYPMEDSAKPDNLVKGGATESGRLELRFEQPGRVRGIVEIGPESAGVRSIVHLVDVPPPGANRPPDGASNSTGSRRE
jgi:DsbC/DsbD-like thiol-disulfide interchange protein